MSIKLMSAVFESEFTCLNDGTKYVTKASITRLVLLARPGHASDIGEGNP